MKDIEISFNMVDQASVKNFKFELTYLSDATAFVFEQTKSDQFFVGE